MSAGRWPGRWRPCRCGCAGVDGRAHEFPEPPVPGAEVVVTDRPLALIEAAPAGSACFVLTHSHSLDFTLCSAVLERGDFAYLGLIGSRTKRAKFERGFAELGIPAARVRADGLPDRRRRVARQAAGGDRRPGRGRAADRAGARGRSRRHSLQGGRQSRERKGSMSEPRNERRRRAWSCGGSPSAFPAWSPTRTSASAWRRARSTRSWARTAPARARWSRSSTACCTPTRARCSGTAGRSRSPTRRRPGRSASAWCSSISRCSRR